MKIVRKIEELLRWRNKIPANKKMGFVPTMGALHEGHFSLIRRSKKENDLTAVSIFVNPIQFNDPQDLKRYKINLTKDIALLRKTGADLLFVPSSGEIYPSTFQTFVQVEKLSRHLCGPFRPNHFQGVATIVLKLFHLLRPQKAYFGMKDYQQYRIIEQMTQDLNLPVQIVPHRTVREPDGLPYSSRNKRLSASERERAKRIFPALQSVAFLLKYTRRLDSRKILSCFRRNLVPSKMDKVEYLEIVDPKTLMPLKKIQVPYLLATAVWIGKTRLIDNLLIKK